MPVNLSIGFIAYLISTLMFFSILIVAFIGQRHRSKGRPFFLLIIATFIWSTLLTMSQIEASIAYEMIFIAELLRYYTWFYVLQHASGNLQLQGLKQNLSNPFSPLYVSMISVMAVITLLFSDIMPFSFNIISITWMLAFTVLGAILVEQLYRNTPDQYRSPIIFLCISAGSVFIFDFFVFSNALLVQQIDYELWSARGFINVLIAPTLIIAAVRNPSLAPNIHISRQFVLHSTTLLGSGLYLILMSLAGYYIKVKSGQWGELLQYTFLFAALLLLASLFFSATIKNRLKHYVNKSFKNKYDYRAEWSRFSNTLLSGDNINHSSIYNQALQAVCQIVNSTGAQLWLKSGKLYEFRADWNMPCSLQATESDKSALINHILSNRELFTTRDFVKSKGLGTNNSHWLLNSHNSWLILPLWLNNSLYGFIHMQSPSTPWKLDSEDRELLTTITHQLALYLSQHETSLELQQAEKFKDINQMTAFLTHDLKTLLSQLFLLVENGKIHKGNPAFIDDMLNTLEHVSQKMQRLVQQLKDPGSKAAYSRFEIIDILNDILNDYQNSPIRPELINNDQLTPEINANKSEIQSALKHIIQNATESVDRQGLVKVELCPTQAGNISIKIMDNGKGMSADFIANRLFRPFDSTKGVSGMGIGVYQSREYIRSLGGEIHVSSQEGAGTTFTITLPTSNNP